MLTTVRSHSARARRTRLRCPACRAPIVGTRPTLRPSQRHASDCALASGTAATTRIARSAPVPGGLAGRLAGIGVLGPRERAVADLGREGPHRLDRLLAQVGVPLHEARRAA